MTVHRPRGEANLERDAERARKEEMLSNLIAQASDEILDEMFLRVQGVGIDKRFSPEMWKDLITETIQQIETLAAVKGAEYAAEGDRLDNFRRNGKDAGVSMEVCWRIYAGKHWDSITTYIRDIATGKDRIRSEPIQGRADDLIVYLILFKAMCRERGVK